MENSQEALEPRYFTIEEANRTLPLVKAITKDLVTLTADYSSRQARLADLKETHRSDPSDKYYAQEFASMESQLEEDQIRILELANELKSLGIEPKNASMGLVDFPCWMEGREVYLCWKFDEPEILFWHEVEAGYAGRQPLPITANL